MYKLILIGTNIRSYLLSEQNNPDLPEKSTTY